jgi:hypothetical protein
MHDRLENGSQRMQAQMDEMLDEQRKVLSGYNYHLIVKNKNNNFSGRPSTSTPTVDPLRLIKEKIAAQRQARLTAASTGPTRSEISSQFVN